MTWITAVPDLGAGARCRGGTGGAARISRTVTVFRWEINGALIGLGGELNDGWDLNHAFILPWMIFVHVLI